MRTDGYLLLACLPACTQTYDSTVFGTDCSEEHSPLVPTDPSTPGFSPQDAIARVGALPTWDVTWRDGSIPSTDRIAIALTFGDAA